MDDGQQGRFRITLDEARVETDIDTRSPQLVAKAVLADRASKGAGHAETGHDLSDIPRRATGHASPLVRANAKQVGERFAK